MSNKSQNRAPIDSQQVARVIEASKIIKKPSINGKGRLARFAVVAALAPVAGGIAAPVVQAEAPTATPVTPAAETASRPMSMNVLARVAEANIQRTGQATINNVTIIRQVRRPTGGTSSHQEIATGGGSAYPHSPKQTLRKVNPIVVDTVTGESGPTVNFNELPKGHSLAYGTIDSQTGHMKLEMLQAGDRIKPADGAAINTFTPIGFMPSGEAGYSLTHPLMLGTNTPIMAGYATTKAPAKPAAPQPQELRV